ncbi:MAG: iron-containing redox enzyme family protein [Pseudomonas shirazensis]
MTVMTRKAAPMVPALTTEDSFEQRYRALLHGHSVDSAQWLARQLKRAEQLADDLPASPAQLSDWAVRHSAQVAAEFATYLTQRREGGSRRYFANRAQALWYIQQVAPTKAVDGAWLHGFLQHWQDPRYHGLIRTFLEELGDGDPRCNHVLIYQRLLSRLGCLELLPLVDERYLQGTVQLALGAHGDAFEAEAIGYNLGYEQPPLHLLITTYELAELGIDGHYFQLHVTIDNAATGHAHKSIQALLQLLPESDAGAYYQRVRQGYRLNELGESATALIASFDLEQELISSLERKRLFGQFMHSDHCRLQGRTINQWLAEPDGMAGFLDALQAQKWVVRGQDPAESRFWRVMEGPTAPMFGVFSAYEKQLWYDWISADWQGPRIRRVAPGSWETGLQLDAPSSMQKPSTAPLETLIARMAGNRHALPAGLEATRAYIRATGLTQENAH